jgi:hypothetical protein
MKLKPGVDFTNMITNSFKACRFQNGKNSVKLSAYFCAFRIFACKNCLLDVDAIDPWGLLHQHARAAFLCEQDKKLFSQFGETAKHRWQKYAPI